jgi:hypothetical protein
MIQHIPKLVGVHRIKLYDEKSGRLDYDTGPITNLVVSSGKNLMMNLLFNLNAPQTALGYLGIGTDTTAPTVLQTQLNPVVTGSVYLQAFDPGTTLNTSTQTVIYQITISTTNGNFTIGEGATFNGPTNGTSIMFNRVLISPTVTKTSAQTAIYICSLVQS